MAAEMIGNLKYDNCEVPTIITFLSPKLTQLLLA
jgi:hypothetical protein